MPDDLKTETGFKTPPRPDWVAKIIDEGRKMDLRSVVRLDAQDLIDTAVKRTGLSNFGPEDWREPFERVVASLDAEANLHLMGRLMTRSDLLMFLEARLRVEDAIARHPEILDEKIEAPIWIFGLGRSGTSLLQTLLGTDPANRSPKQWEVMLPAPLPEGADLQAEIDAVSHRIDQWNRVTPETRTVHEFNGMEEAEILQFEALAFRAPAWMNLLGMAPSYTGYIMQQPYRLSYDYVKRVFQVMQWSSGKKRRWVFKSPDSIHHLDDVLAVFPDAKLIWAHRDPVKTIASIKSLLGTLSWIRSDQTLPDVVYEGITSPPHVLQTIQRPLDWMASGAIPAAQIAHVACTDLIAEPVQTVKAAYEALGVPFTEETRKGIVDYFAAHPKEALPKHRYDYASPEKLREQRALFVEYQQRFGIKNEV